MTDELKDILQRMGATDIVINESAVKFQWREASVTLDVSSIQVTTDGQAPNCACSAWAVGNS